MAGKRIAGFKQAQIARNRSTIPSSRAKPRKQGQGNPLKGRKMPRKV